MTIPTRYRRAAHLGGALVWALLLVPALLWWPASVAFVIVASVYANVKSDLGAAEAADDRAVLDRLAELDARLARIEVLLTRDPQEGDT